jgi:hypothetical protein
MNTEEKKAPDGAVYTITVPLDSKRSKTATYHLKEMEEEVYIAAKTLMDQDKDFAAVVLMTKALLVPKGSDDPSLLQGNFVACRSAVQLFRQILTPIDGELKKN